MLEHRSCVLACCDECGDYYGENADGVLYYASTEDALNDITTPYMADELAWVAIEGGRLRCDRCEAYRLCRTHGHVWQPWRRCLCQGMGLETDCGRAVRFCDRCPSTESTHESDRAGGAR
ncbi:hypothetical protein E1181_07985 [Saccharopolyspora terrae]|uniref:Uncharacterized protein n=1 Tax=Saccharopolyspora terrae TaxID=2530384 RepID=A0A4V6PCR1_9PSEU|nr:hypothetical protein [Saccharopolyspora terrae]TDD08106.1 hypothetical protein E1181_07985 [Saccharopolyspora terrae]